MPMSLSIRPYTRWKNHIPCQTRKNCLLHSVMGLLIVSVMLWINAGYHAGFQTINNLGAVFPDSFWSSITLLGDTRVSLALLLFFIYRYPLLLPAALIASIPATLISHGFKHFINLPRPVVEFGVDNINQIGDVLKMGSFPSGHSTTVGVFAGLILLLSHNVIHRRLVLSVMVLVGVSRVMVGAHYPIDVLVGLSLGLVSALFGFYMVNRFQLMRHPLSQWLMLLIPFIAAYLVFQHDGGYPQGELFAKTITIIAVMAYFHRQLSVHSFYRHDVCQTLIGDAINLAKVIKKLVLSTMEYGLYVLKTLMIKLIYILVYLAIAMPRFIKQLEGVFAEKISQLIPYSQLKLTHVWYERGRVWASIRRCFWRTDVMLFILSVVVLTSFPAIDLVISHLFYDANTGEFPYKHQPIVYFIYKLVSNLPIILLLVLPVLAWKRYRKYSKNDVRKVRNIFFLICLVLGPGILANTILKDNSIGRARPVHIQEFGGDKTFTAAFEYSGQCNRNCSFVSGHAAMGFFFIALGWVFASRAWFWGGLSIGLIVGLGRIIQGGHFFSDVVFAFWAVYLVTCLLGRAFNMAHPLAKRRRRRHKVSVNSPVIA